LGEVCEDGNVVVGEVDALLVACGAEVLDGGDLVACGNRERLCINWLFFWMQV
jgi:hypothetical protein